MKIRIRIIYVLNPFLLILLRILNNRYHQAIQVTQPLIANYKEDHPAHKLTIPPSSAQNAQGVNAKKRKDKSPALSTPSKKKRTVTGSARKPSPAILKFTMDYYDRYDPTIKVAGHNVKGVYVLFIQYSRYKLFMIPSVTIAKNIPKAGVRLDNMHIAIVIESGEFSKKALTTNWQAEFDKNGITRASRVPLGHAVKEWKAVGEVDIYGQVVANGEEGWYYLWHREL